MLGADVSGQLLSYGPWGLVAVVVLSAFVWVVLRWQDSQKELIAKTDLVARITTSMTEALNDANAKRDETHAAHLKHTAAVEELTRAIDRLTTRLNERADGNQQRLDKILELMNQLRIAGAADARTVRQ